MEKAISLVGILIQIGICYAISTNRKKVNWKLVAVGIGLQFIFALLILKTVPGRMFFDAMNNVFVTLLGFTQEGAQFVFGNLAQINIPVGTPQPGPPPGFADLDFSSTEYWAKSGAYFAFGVMPTVIFFASFMTVLYHLGIMQRLVYYVAIVMERTMGTSGAESLSAAANIFVGQTEAPLVVAPYVSKMTQSELMAIMSGGLATIAGGVMAAYVGMLAAKFPDIAGHLMAASVMSAPASLVFAKILVPETEEPETSGQVDLPVEKVDQNVIDAAARGASEGMRLAINIVAMLIAFLALVAMGNHIWGWFVNAIAGLTGMNLSAIDSLQEVMGFIFAPLAWVMGVPASDLLVAGQLLGEKTILNEFVAYAHFGDIINGKTIVDGVTIDLTERTRIIMAYALCGFANLGSIGILLGGIGGIAPNRRGDLAKLGIRALIAGTFASFVTANIAGVLL
ncbi:MAG: NupC/NupG family nucleoside CNT transporter [Gemmatimonadetes bacterium]|nr:MAG: NupC/NupG family nucleoside CNT transporter [Gemmatimonadota bacterium]